MRVRKKPVEVDAVQLTWPTWNEMCDFAGVGKLADGKPEGCYIDEDGNATDSATSELGLRIPTREGVMLAREADWVIRGVAGELYPCKPDIFEQTYELVGQGESQEHQCEYRNEVERLRAREARWLEAFEGHTSLLLREVYDEAMVDWRARAALGEEA